MDRYELVEGSSSKFWEVAVSGETLTVRFGRIGTSGQSKDKDFADTAAAEKEMAKLVKEKTGKGYALVATSEASTPASPAKPKPEVTASEEPEAVAPKTAARKSVEADTPPAAEPVPAPIEPTPQPARSVADITPPAAAAAPIRTPDPLPAEPLPTRVRPAGTLDADASWTELMALVKPLLPVAAQAPEKAAPKKGAITSALTSLFGKKQQANPESESAPDAGSWLARSIAEGRPQTLEPETIVNWANALVLCFAETLPNHWQMKSPQQLKMSKALRHFAHWVLATADGRTAARAINHMRPDWNDSYKNSSWSRPLDLAFRSAITKAADADYEAVLATFLEIASDEPDWKVKAWFAFMLADDRPNEHELKALTLLEAAAAAGEDVSRNLPMMPLTVDARQSRTARWRNDHVHYLYLVYTQLTLAEVAATIIAVARDTDEPALPTLEWLLHYQTDQDRTDLTCIILGTDEDGAAGLVIPLIHEKPVRAGIDRQTSAAPERTFRQLLSAYAAGRVEPALKSRLLDLIHKNGAETAMAWAAGTSSAGVAATAKLLAAQNVELAPDEALPDALRDPRWRRKGAKKGEDIVLAVEAKPTRFVYSKTEASGVPDTSSYWRLHNAVQFKSLNELPAFMRKADEETQGNKWWGIPAPSTPVPADGANPEQMMSWLDHRLREIIAIRSWAVSGGEWNKLFASIEKHPDELALCLWECSPAMTAFSGFYIYPSIAPMLERFGERAETGFIKMVEMSPTEMLTIALDVDSAALAPIAARAMLKLKKARLPGMQWLRRHPETSITRLIPDAVGKKGIVRDSAEHALRWFAGQSEEGRARIEAIARDYAKTEPKIMGALGEVLDRDPLAQVPNKVANTPGWFTPAMMSRPELKTGGALSNNALEALAEMLSFSSPGAVYAGVYQVKEACTPPSLAAFAWDLFSAWLAEGAPSKDGWAMRALGWMGDDDSARQLTRLIRKWPGEAAHARAVTGLDVLVDIGSDIALMNLNGIAEKLKFKGLQEKAREKIAEIAEARDLTPEELADRLAPDLDLDERGGLDIDFGERKFRAGFDEFLKPWVKDATGQRLKDLPKPNKSDDPELSKEASARWSGLKKDARAVASLQITRLETMLSTSRRVKREVFWDFFAAHPLIRHLTQRLVWGVYGDADARTTPTLLFRVADDLSLTDQNDDAIEIEFSSAEPGVIGLVHPLHMPAGGLDKWGALFGDYEIAQPFPQLGRETYELTEAEKNGSDIARFDGVKIESKRLRGMGSNGWALGSPQDGGGISWLERPVQYSDGAKSEVIFNFENGLIVGAVEYEDAVQTLRMLSLENNWYGRQKTSRTFNELDPVTISELLRGPSKLVEHRVE